MIGSDHSGEIQTEALPDALLAAGETSPACVGLTLAGSVQRVTDLYAIPWAAALLCRPVISRISKYKIVIFASYPRPHRQIGVCRGWARGI